MELEPGELILPDLAGIEATLDFSQLKTKGTLSFTYQVDGVRFFCNSHFFRLLGIGSCVFII